MKHSKQDITWTTIENDSQMETFYQQNLEISWLSFDTEFIPERYFYNKLCLISLVTPLGNYIIDVLKVPDIGLFIRLIDDPAILKITHAGENDYRILVAGYEAKPKNMMDTQLCHGFLAISYPMGLQMLLRNELQQRIDKVSITSDWEKRPLTREQLGYAIRDVLYLHPLLKRLESRLERKGKLEWAQQENRIWEEPGYFIANPLDFLQGLMLKNLSRKKKIFLIRLYQWRRMEASHRNRPESGILKTRYINHIVKHINAGKNALMKDRTFPKSVLMQHWPTFRNLFEREIDKQEHDLLAKLNDDEDSPQVQLMMEMLHQLIKWKANSHAISPLLILSRRELNKMKAEPDYFPDYLEQGWRKELLGPELLIWLKLRRPIQIKMEQDRCIITMPRLIAET